MNITYLGQRAAQSDSPTNKPNKPFNSPTATTIQQQNNATPPAPALKQSCNPSTVSKPYGIKIIPCQWAATKQSQVEQNNPSPQLATVPTNHSTSPSRQQNSNNKIQLPRRGIKVGNSLAGTTSSNYESNAHPLDDDSDVNGH